MGFEDSMIEDGFHNEEEYLDHLLDEAESDWIRRQQQNDYVEEYPEECDGYDEEESYKLIGEKYRKWIKENPLKKELFIAWGNAKYGYTTGIYPGKYYPLDIFVEWKDDEQYHLAELKDYYGSYYDSVYSYLKWKVENNIENKLLLEEFEKNDMEFGTDWSCYPPEELPLREVLLQEIVFFEQWMDAKREYIKWVSEASEIDRAMFLGQMEKAIFGGDTSIEHIRSCIENDGLYDFVRDDILKIYDNDPEKVRGLIYEMECVRYHSAEYVKSNWSAVLKQQISRRNERNGI